MTLSLISFGIKILRYAQNDIYAPAVVAGAIVLYNCALMANVVK